MSLTKTCFLRCFCLALLLLLCTAFFACGKQQPDTPTSEPSTSKQANAILPPDFPTSPPPPTPDQLTQAQARFEQLMEEIGVADIDKVVVVARGGKSPELQFETTDPTEVADWVKWLQSAETSPEERMSAAGGTYRIICSSGDKTYPEITYNATNAFILNAFDRTTNVMHCIRNIDEIFPEFHRLRDAIGAD
jgi:hypothetical protein